MIQRIVLLKLVEEFATDTDRAAVADYSRKVLTALPGVLRAEIGSPADAKSAESWDISLVLNFASTDDLEPFRVHPEHRAYVDEYLKPKLALIKAWNFRIA
jgi:hypothetical protein